MRCSNCKLLLFLTGVFLFAGELVAQGPDRVILQNDSATGKIVGYTATHYLFETDDKKQRVPRTKVKNIQYGDTTKGLASMARAFIKDQYGEVLSNAENVRKEIENGELRGIHKPRVSYYIAASHFRQGSFDQAVTEVKKAFEQFPNQVWFDKMARIRILAFTFMQYDPKKQVSDQTYKKVEQVGEAVISLCQNKTDAPKSMVERLKVLRIEALEELGKGKLQVTKVKYDNLEVSTPALKQRVFTGSQRCLIRLGNQDKLKTARNAFKKKMNNGASMLLKAGYHNANGALSLSKWKNDGDKKLMRDALLSFVRAQLVYHEPTDVPYSIQHRQSLINTIRLYHTIAENGSDEGGDSYYEKQAQNTFQELKSRYPGAPEVKKAKVILGK